MQKIKHEYFCLYLMCLVNGKLRAPDCLGKPHSVVGHVELSVELPDEDVTLIKNIKI